MFIVRHIFFNEITVVDGRDAIISCNSDSTPVWYMEEAPLPPNIIFTNISNVYNLQILSFNKMNVGTYVCRVKHNNDYVYNIHNTKVSLKGNNIL